MVTKYWSWLPFPSPGDLSNPGIESVSPALTGGFLLHHLEALQVWVSDLFWVFGYMDSDKKQKLKGQIVLRVGREGRESC